MAPATTIPPPPWCSDVDALLWWRGPDAFGGLVHYRAGPVGPYRELLAGRIVLAGGLPCLRVELMAVDSAASMVAGRRNWALPKTLARFDGSEVRGDGWAATVRARERTRSLPVVASLPCAQVGADGVPIRFEVSLRGRARLARVAVDVQGDAPAPALRPTRGLAVAISGLQLVGVPRGVGDDAPRR